MYISENTKNGIEFAAHATAADAVQYLLAELGADYANDFWASADGQIIVISSTSFRDFAVQVHASPRAAMQSIEGLDDDALPIALRALADAIAAGVSRDL